MAEGCPMRRVVDAKLVVTLSVIQSCELDRHGRLLQHVGVHNVVCWHVAKARCTVVLLEDGHFKVIPWVSR